MEYRTLSDIARALQRTDREQRHITRQVIREKSPHQVYFLKKRDCEHRLQELLWELILIVRRRGLYGPVKERLQRYYRSHGSEQEKIALSPDEQAVKKRPKPVLMTQEKGKNAALTVTGGAQS